MSWWCNISFHKIRRSRNLINLIPDRFPFLLILYTCVPLGIFNSEYPYVNILKYERSLIRSPLACVCELSEKKNNKITYICFSKRKCNYKSTIYYYYYYFSKRIFLLLDTSKSIKIICIQYKLLIIKRSQIRYLLFTFSINWTL